MPAPHWGPQMNSQVLQGTVYRAVVTLLLFVAAAGCTRHDEVETSLQTGASRLYAASEGSGIGQSQAEAIVRAQAIVAAGQQDASLPKSASTLVGIDAYQSLLKTAIEKIQDLPGETAKAQTWLQELRAPARAELVSQASTLLHDATSNFANGSAAHALLTSLKGETELDILRADLVSAVPAGTNIPANKFELVPPPHLENAIASLKRQLNGLLEQESIVADGTRAPLISALEAKLRLMESAASSVARSQFLGVRADVFGKIDVSRWNKLTATRAERVESRFSANVASAEAAANLPELLLARYESRGPPDSLAIESARDFDINPTKWCWAEAELAVIASELAASPQTPSRVRALRLPLERVASMLHSDTLIRIRDIARKAGRSQETWLPSDFLFPEKYIHLEAWATAAEKELEARKTGATRVVPASVAYEDLAKQRKRHVEIRFLEVLQVRFPEGDAMPRELVAERNRIVLDTLHDYSERISTSLQRYAKTSRRITLSDKKLSFPEAEHIAAARTSIATMGQELQGLKDAASRLGLKSNQAVEATITAAALESSPKSPPHRGETGSADPRGWASVLRVQIAAGGAVRRYQTKLEKHLVLLNAQSDRLEQALNRSEAITTNLPDGTVKPYGMARGRITASAAALQRGQIIPRSLTPDESKSRLPESVAAWVGRLDDGGKPFDYRSVKDPRTPKVIGGGIHFGEVATLGGKVRLSTAVVTYERGKGLLIRDGQSGMEWIVDKDIDPTSLRALYRFIAHGRNAAISVGWGLGTDDADDDEASTAQVVYLDPYLVDTKVGQDLLIADSRPWSFGNPAHDAGGLSFSGEFGRAHRAFSETKDPRLKAWLESVPIPSAEDADLLFVKQAVDFQTMQIRMNTIEHDAEVMLRDYMKTHPNENETELRKEALKRASSELEPWMDKVRQLAIDNVGRGHAEQRAATLRQMVQSSFAKEGGASISLLRAAVQLNLRLPSETRKNVFSWLASLPQTLAVLYDDAVTIELSDAGAAAYDTQMKYRYVTQPIAFDKHHLGIAKDPSGSELMTIKSLTNLANGNLPEVMRHYPDVASVKHYAEVAAFLRWAELESKAGTLGMFDMSNLATVNANDRDAFPTIDALVK